jgi:hypothetical protein
MIVIALINLFPFVSDKSHQKLLERKMIVDQEAGYREILAVSPVPPENTLRPLPSASLPIHHPLSPYVQYYFTRVEQCF